MKPSSAIRFITVSREKLLRFETNNPRYEIRDMKSASSIILIFLSALSAVGQIEDCPPPPAAPTARKEFQLASVNYYQQSDTIKVTTSYATILTTQNENISVSIYSKNNGRKVLRPRAVTLDFSIQAKTPHFADNSKLDVYLDDKLVYTADTKKVLTHKCGGVFSVGNSSIRYEYDIDVFQEIPYQMLAEILAAQTTTIQLGKVRFDINKADKNRFFEVLREFKEVIETTSAADIADTTAPLYYFDKAVKANNGFFESRERLKKVLLDESVRLGRGFHAELRKYLGQDFEKHYWVGVFLSDNFNLPNGLSAPEIAFFVWENGFDLIKDKTDKESLANKFTILVWLTVQAQKIKRSLAAFSYKNAAAEIAEQIDVASHFPALSEYDNCLYENTGKDTGVCQKLFGKP